MIRHDLPKPLAAGPASLPVAGSGRVEETRGPGSTSPEPGPRVGVCEECGSANTETRYRPDGHEGDVEGYLYCLGCGWSE